MWTVSYKGKNFTACQRDIWMAYSVPLMEEKTTWLCWLKTPSPYLVTNSRYHLYEWNYLWLVKHLFPLREWIVVSGLWCGTKFYFCYFYNDIVDISLERGTLECLLICQGSLYYKLYFGKKNTVKIKYSNHILWSI